MYSLSLIISMKNWTLLLYEESFLTIKLLKFMNKSKNKRIYLLIKKQYINWIKMISITIFLAYKIHL